MNNELQKIKEQVKANIITIIGKGNLKEAQQLLNQYISMANDDIEVFSIQAVIYIHAGQLAEAQDTIETGLRIDDNNFDLLYNSAYIFGIQKKYREAALLYLQLTEKQYTQEQQRIASEAFTRLKENHPEVANNRKKIVFFVKEGMDSFIGEVIKGFEGEYELKKIIVTDLQQIDQEMIWADICWFEWCDELITYGSKLTLAKTKKIICRIHGYEVYSDFVKQTNWENVNQIIVVTPHILRIFKEKIDENILENTKINLVYCGVDIELFPFKKRKKSYNIGYLGYINFKKNIPLTLNIFYQLYLIDKRYKLYLAGSFQDERTLRYLHFFVHEHKLQNHIFFDGWQTAEQKIKWFEKIDYMLISSIDEGLCYAAAESMVSGIKPILHKCEGLKDHYPEKYLFTTPQEAIQMITEDEYNSREYQQFIKGYYAQEKQSLMLMSIINSLYENELQEDMHSFEKKYRCEWQEFKQRLNFDIDNIEDVKKKSKKNLRSILIITPSLDIGGAEAYTISKAQWLVKQGYDIVVVSKGGKWEQRISDIGGKHYKVDWLDEDPESLSIGICETRIMWLKEIIDREHIDVIEGHNLYPAVYGFILNQKYRIPYLFHCLNTFDFTEFKKYIPMLQELNDKNLYYIGNRNPNIEIEQSNNIVLDKCNIIRIFLSLDEIIDGTIARGGYCLTVSRMAPVKEYVIHLIKNFARMCMEKRIKDFKLIVVGDGPMFPIIQQQVIEVNKLIKTFGCRVDLKGFVDGEALEKLYMKCDMFIGSGLSALKAAAYRKPTILATHYPYDTTVGYGYLNNPDIIVPLGENLNTRFNPKAYGEYIYELLADKELYQQRAQQCYDVYKANYSIDEAMKRWINAYEEKIGIVQ